MQMPIEHRATPRGRQPANVWLEFGTTLAATLLVVGAAYAFLGLMPAALILGFALALALVFGV
ncbi:MAG TPA: hypothetical protein PKA95_18050 [Thermomicrobiales bacterium]|nr:hypothetical protein [Thermomicrobiales bacterium]